MEHGSAPRTWRGRLGEILLEIAIIVFAITLSIWLHSWQEHRHDRARERQFLLGLREDLDRDLRELREDSTSYVMQQRGMRYFRRLGLGAAPNDSLKQYSWVLTNGTWFIPNSSRFEGFKYSGGLSVLENDSLLARILIYYERTTTNLAMNAKTYSETKRATVMPFVNEHLDPDGSNFLEVIRQRPMQNVAQQGSQIGYIIDLYHQTAQEARHLRHAIEAQLRAD